MRKSHLILVSILLLMSICLIAHDEKAPIIIDTDCAPDDLRAICLMLADSHVDVKAISITPGACSAEISYQKVKALLKELGRDNIAVVAGAENSHYIPAWREFATSIRWGKEEGKFPASEGKLADSLLAVINSNENTTLIMLGSLANLEALLQAEPNLESKISSMLWFNNYPETEQGENFRQAPDSAKYVLDKGVSLKIFSNSAPAGYKFDLQMYTAVKGIFNPYARIIRDSHAGAEAQKRIVSDHFGIWDELIPVWFSSPELFSFTQSKKWDNCYLASLPAEEDLNGAYLDILTAAGGRQASVLLRKFPLQSENFRKDLAPYVDEIVKRHGEEEWRFVVLTSELHRHLGVYSIVGAKMGLRAREILGADLDEVTVISYSGLKPPISCLNDGLQISTGATLGQGKIEVKTEQPRVKAEFFFKNQKLTLTLKSEVIEMVKTRISEGVKTFGLNSPLYWKYVRENAIECWLILEREKIFEEKLN